MLAGLEKNRGDQRARNSRQWWWSQEEECEDAEAETLWAILQDILDLSEGCF